MKIGKDSASSGDTGSPVTQQSITGFEAASIDTQAVPLAIGAGIGIGEAHYSSGNDICFANDSGSGEKLLAHELTHVVQQSKGRSV